MKNKHFFRRVISLSAAAAMAASAVISANASASWNMKRIIGDLNGDSAVNIADYLLLSKHVLNVQSLGQDTMIDVSNGNYTIGSLFDSDSAAEIGDAQYIDAADMNQDGRINSLDLVLMRKALTDYNTVSAVYEWEDPQADAEFVAKMEDVLDVYQRSYDPSRPVVCIDETNKQLIIEKRVPCKPGEPEKLDSVYVRNGVADIFMISEPLAGKRKTVVKQTRTAIDFAEILRYTADELYPKAEKIILVTDNLNIHAPSSLYKAFSAQEANRLTKRFEWHYTPKHGSWLDMAEIEIGVMSRQALAKPFPDLESFEKQVRSWTVNRNAKFVKINWQFTTADARIKLAKLYPTTL